MEHKIGSKGTYYSGSIDVSETEIASKYIKSIVWKAQDFALVKKYVDNLCNWDNQQNKIIIYNNHADLKLAIVIFVQLFTHLIWCHRNLNDCNDCRSCIESKIEIWFIKVFMWHNKGSIRTIT